MKISQFFTDLGSTLKSCVKIAALSRPCTLREAHDNRPLLIMGNGPSLRQVLDDHPSVLDSCALMSVNFAANAPEFFDLKPEYYVMADGVFFSNDPDNAALQSLYQSFACVNWDMTLIIPRQYRRRVPESIRNNPNISVKTINAVGLEGFTAFQNLVYSMRMGMPRPRNVLIVSIVAGIWLGYKTVYIVGADHSWMQTIAVDDQNRVISVQPHFYKDSAKEQQRVNTIYSNLHLHDIVNSFYVAFRSYHRIASWASRRRIKIYNATPNSFIDAFPRTTL